MDKIKVHFDPTDNSLIIWFDDSEKMAYLSPIEEDTPGDFHLIKAEDGRVIGIECQFYGIPAGSISLDVETARLLIESGLLGHMPSG